MASSRKKAASFSIRMTVVERECLDSFAVRYDRPRSWIMRKMVQTMAGLEKERRAGRLTEVQATALKMLEKGFKAPIRKEEDEED